MAIATPRKFRGILKRLGFKKGSGGSESDHWYTKPKGMTSEVWVEVYDDDEWFITWEEVRDKGVGTASLVKSLKGFLSQGKRTNENEELEELTGTGGVAGFGTPYAFATKEPVSSKKKKRVNETISLKALLESDPYYPWRNDETQTPKQKIGRAISEINKQLAEVEKVVKRTQRLKKETGTSNNALWNRTNKSLMKIESRMHKISQTIRNMR